MSAPCPERAGGPACSGLSALRRSLSALLARTFDDRVRTREHQAGVTVVETHQVGRLTARSADLDDLACPVRLAHDVAMHVEPVPDGCLHEPTSSPAFARHPSTGGHAHGVPYHYGQYLPRSRWLIAAIREHRAASGLSGCLPSRLAGRPGS